MGVIKVYGAAMSTAAQRVFTCLYEKELDFEFVPVDMASGEHKKEAYLSLNPFGQVPALEHGGQKIFESRAITQYVAMEYPEKGTRLASADKPSSSFLIWKEVEAHQFDPVASKLTWEIVLKPMFGMTVDPAIVEEYEAKLAKVLDVYEARLTKSKYLASDSFTLVDMHHLPTINLLMRTQVKELFNACPRVSAWVADITARPAWTKAQMISKTNELHKLTDEVSLRKERDISLDVSGSVKNVHESISSQPYDKKTSIQGEQFGSSKFQVDVNGSVKNVHESISSQPYDKKTSIQGEQLGSSKFQVMQEQLDISPKKMEYLEAKQSHSQPMVAASPLMVQTSKSILNSNDNNGTNSDDEGSANSNENCATKSYENSDLKSDGDGDNLKSEDDTDAKSNDDGDHAKSDSDSDAKSEGKGDAKSEDDGDAKSDSEDDAKSNGDDDAKSNGDDDAKSDGDDDAKSNGDDDAKSDGDDDAKSEGDGDAKSDSDGDAKSDGDGDAKSEGDGDAKSDGDGDAKSEGDGDAKSDGGGDSSSEDDG
ncbi:hypothetical protein WN944_017019 [Citrus x changshan-huyou]|uniref:glutathione transferase n=1 Tax=Citrus x changshan-huyou TaxID=2935761 RepID=A0AAP0MAG3_9ROSI